MAMEVVLQDERGNDIGEAIRDPIGVIADCVPDPNDASYSCIRFVDPYGDTIFNRLQAVVAVKEWDRVGCAFSEMGAQDLWAGVRQLLVCCSEEPHTYVRFTGD